MFAPIMCIYGTADIHSYAPWSNMLRIWLEKPVLATWSSGTLAIDHLTRNLYVRKKIEKPYFLYILLSTASI